MNFWVKLNYLNHSNNSKIKRTKIKQHRAQSNPRPTWPSGAQLGWLESQRIAPVPERGKALRARACVLGGYAGMLIGSRDEVVQPGRLEHQQSIVHLPDNFTATGGK
jgi:hypothetical protein